PEIGSGHGKTDIVQGQRFYVAGIQAIRRQHAQLEVFPRHLWNVPDFCLLRRSTARKLYVHVIERYILHDGFAHAVENDTRKDLTRIIVAGEFEVPQLYRLDHRGMDTAERDIAKDTRRL